jgi:phage terminase large subunit-like protein
VKCSSANLLSSSRLEKLRSGSAELTEDEVDYWLDDFRWWASRGQNPPEGDWIVWLYLGGRGAGKTRAGAEWVAQHVREGRAQRIGLIAATHSEARAVMIEGESGLLRVSEGAEYQPSLRRVRWNWSGAEAHVLSADEPDAIRGFQFDLAWADEFCKWADPQTGLDMIRMALRLGEHPRMMITTTPRPIRPLLELVKAPGVSMTHSRTTDNRAHLPKSFLDGLLATYKGTRLGRQELNGEIIEDLEGAFWKRAQLESCRVASAPECEKVVVAVDPPASTAGTCGIVVAGVLGNIGYVMADRSLEGLNPDEWADRVAGAYEEFNANRVIAEANQGGDMVASTMHHVHPNMYVHLVHATNGKRARAEPVAALYGKGRVKHAGLFPQLEDQMCQYDGKGKSPDRLDALVWALTELFPQNREAIPRARAI